MFDKSLLASLQRSREQRGGSTKNINKSCSAGNNSKLFDTNLDRKPQIRQYLQNYGLVFKAKDDDGNYSQIQQTTGKHKRRSSLKNSSIAFHKSNSSKKNTPKPTGLIFVGNEVQKPSKYRRSSSKNKLFSIEPLQHASTGSQASNTHAMAQIYVNIRGHGNPSSSSKKTRKKSANLNQESN